MIPAIIADINGFVDIRIPNDFIFFCIVWILGIGYGFFLGFSKGKRSRPS